MNSAAKEVHVSPTDASAAGAVVIASGVLSDFPDSHPVNAHTAAAASAIPMAPRVLLVLMLFLMFMFSLRLVFVFFVMFVFLRVGVLGRMRM